MKIGYCMPNLPQLASFRLRVAIPAPHIGYPYEIGKPGDVSFFFKQGNVALADSLMGPVVYDVVNDHFNGEQREDYLGMCGRADVITCASESMAQTVFEHTGRRAVVVDDPYENQEADPACRGDGVLWFGHSANASSLAPYALLPQLRVCSNLRGAIPWTRENEDAELANCAVVLLTGSNPGASANRLVKAIRAGRYVVTDGNVKAWEEFKGLCWIGDIEEGIEWAKNNREAACRKVKEAQDWVRHRYSPQTIGAKWSSVFAGTLTARSDSTLALGRSASRVG